MRVLADRYILDEEIASGGSVTVWHGTDQTVGDAILVRTYDLENSEEEAKQHLQRETRAVGALRHPNVAAVRDQGFDQETFFTVMERLDGRDLLQLDNQDGPLPPARANSVRRQILSALGHAKTAGINHAPVRPENVIVDARDRVQVTLPISPTARTPIPTSADDAAKPGSMSESLSSLLESLAVSSTEGVEASQPEVESDPQTVWPIPGDRYDPARLGRIVILALVVLALVALTAFILRVTSEVDKRKDEAPSISPSVEVSNILPHHFALHETQGPSFGRLPSGLITAHEGVSKTRSQTGARV